MDTFLTFLTLGILRFFIVPQGYCRVVTQWGKFLRIAEPGMNFCWFFWGLFQKPDKEIPLLEQVRDYPDEKVYTKDGVEVLIDSVVYFTVKDPYSALFKVQDYEQAIKALVQSILRNECGNLTVRELFAARAELAKRLQDQLIHGSAPWGIDIRLVEIKNLEVMQKRTH